MQDMQNIQHYGIKEFTNLQSALDGYIEELRINGFAIIPDIIDSTTIGLLQDKLDEIYSLQKAEVKEFGDLAQINDANIARALLAYDESYLRLASQPLFLELAEKLLGDTFILQMQNGIINLPNRKNYQMAWHRDLNYQHFTSSRPLALSILVCLDDFSAQTGSTFVLPGTHKNEAFPSAEFVQRNEHNIVAKAGSALVMDSMLYHRAGFNSSQKIRRGINHMYCLPFLKQQISLPSMLKGKYAEDAFLNKFLGYDSESGDSVMQWRQRKFIRNRSQNDNTELITVE
jgi:ectoine hydroxylase-related dioxygenase (phytanoyl-CoA dioxygenase family)